MKDTTWQVFAGCFMVMGLVGSLDLSSAFPILWVTFLAIISIDPILDFFTDRWMQILDFFTDRWMQITKTRKIQSSLTRNISIEDWQPGQPPPLGLSYRDCREFYDLRSRISAEPEKKVDTEVDIETFLTGKEGQDV